MTSLTTLGVITITAIQRRGDCGEKEKLDLATVDAELGFTLLALIVSSSVNFCVVSALTFEDSPHPTSSFRFFP